MLSNMRCLLTYLSWDVSASLDFEAAGPLGALLVNVETNGQSVSKDKKTSLARRAKNVQENIQHQIIQKSSRHML